MIAQYLINNFDTTIIDYFPSVDYKDDYAKAIKQIDHHEPWVTLVVIYSLLGNMKNINAHRINALNKTLNSSFSDKRINLTTITNVKVEEMLPEIMSYRSYLKNIFTKDNFHLYPDRRKAIANKIKTDASFEGNTNLDLLIQGKSNERAITIYIEAKFLSDISYQIKYNPVRDQIARNIDNGIDYVLANNLSFEDFYFMLLTPQVFRPYKFGLPKISSINEFRADRSRLYSYKMTEYSDFTTLKNSLPHRNLYDSQWETISRNIGWITFEEFYENSVANSTYENNNEAAMIKTFFEERNLLP